jgi:hypothetical protein
LREKKKNKTRGLFQNKYSTRKQQGVLEEIKVDLHYHRVPQNPELATPHLGTWTAELENNAAVVQL